MADDLPVAETPAPTGGGTRRRRVVEALRRHGPWLYVGAVAAAALWLTIGRPIVAADQDLWFHMAHGRTIVEQGDVPGDSYFSFLTPPRQGIDYYWLFQPLIYGVHALGGYPGVIVLRALLFGGLLLCVGFYLFRDGGPDRGRWWLCLVFGLAAVYFLQRTPAVRPHSVSFLMIALFLVLLDRGGRWLLPLPFLAVLWTNVHGIEFPVMLLILGAYLADLLAGRWRRGGAPTAGERWMLAVAALSMAAVFATPYGLRLVRLPFQATGSISWVIEEMARPPWAEYLKFDASLTGLSSGAQFNLILAMAAVAALTCLVRRRARLADLLLFAGGLMLLTQGYRFTFECALLMLPVLRAGAWAAGTAPGGWRVPELAVVSALLALPALSLARQLPTTRGAWPLSLENLPHGTVSFLRQADVEGTLMNPPRHGGFLFWSLYPRFRIAMDLEMAFLFDERDLFEVESAYRNPAALARYLDRWQPSFVMAPLTAGRFAELIRSHPRYRLVFFDDAGALYADGERHPELVERWRLAAVDPFPLAATRFSALPPAARASLRQELERVVAVDPRIGLAQRSLAILANLDGRHSDALVHAEQVIAREPLSAYGHALVGDALVGLDRHAEAEAAYRRALRRARGDDRRSILLSLAGVLNAGGRFGEAYETLVAAVGEFDVDLPARELYRLGILAAQSGEAEKAARFFELARFKVPPEDDLLNRQLDAALGSIAAGR